MDETVKAQIDFLKDSLKIMNDTNYDSLRKISLDTIDRMEKQLLVQRVVSSATSRDYNRLFDKISKGEIVPCFVDYDWRDGTPPFRDIAKVQRRKKNSIMVGARGIQYGGVYEFALDGRTELKAFTDECERMNLEYFT